MPDREARMGGTRRGTQRVTQREAAEILGVSVEAIRKRIKRGTLPSEKGEDGRRYVYLDAAPDAAPQADHAGHAYPQTEGRRHVDPAPLVEELRDRVRFLEDQLRQEREARERADHIVAGLIQRIPEIEAPAQAPTTSEPRESPTAATPQPGRVGPQTEVEGPSEAEGAQPRSWWRRMFGG